MSKALLSATGMISRKKKSRNVVTLETKLRIIDQVEAGARFSAVGRGNNLNESTIRTIVKNKEKYKKAIENVGPMAATITRYRNPLILEMETLLLAWIDDLKRSAIPMTSRQIKVKALSLWSGLKAQQGGNVEETFKASKGWYERFRKRINFERFREHDDRMDNSDSDVDLKGERYNEPESTAEHDRMDSDSDSLPLSVICNVDETEVVWNRNENRLTVVLVGDPSSDNKGTVSPDNTDDTPSLSDDVIREALSYHDKCMALLETNDSDLKRVRKIKSGCNALFECYRQILENR